MLKILAIIALLLFIAYMLLMVGSSLLGLVFMKVVYDEMSDEEKEGLKDEIGLKRK